MAAFNGILIWQRRSTTVTKKTPALGNATQPQPSAKVGREQNRSDLGVQRSPCPRRRGRCIDYWEEAEGVCRKRGRSVPREMEGRGEGRHGRALAVAGLAACRHAVFLSWRSGACTPVPLSAWEGEAKPSRLGTGLRASAQTHHSEYTVRASWVRHGCTKKEAYIWVSKISQSSKDTKICRPRVYFNGTYELRAKFNL
jgi:hypothetical protein